MPCCAWPSPALLEIGSSEGDFIDCAHEIAECYASFDCKANGVYIEREDAGRFVPHRRYLRALVFPELDFRVELVALARLHSSSCIDWSSSCASIDSWATSAPDSATRWCEVWRSSLAWG